MRSITISYLSSTIFYRITGKGKPIVLIHGFGEDGDIWQRQIECLQEHYLLIIPDLPGSGRSEFIRGADIETYSEIIKEIITIELPQLPLQGAEGVVILGHSLGGYITLSFAEKYPRMLSSFGLVHSTAYADSEEKKAARARSNDFISRNGAYEFLRTAIPGLFSPQSLAGLQPEIETLVEKGKNFSSDTLIQYYQAMIARPDRTHILKNFSRPILLIIGEQDNAVPFLHSMQQTHMPSVSYVSILRNSAHMGMLEETGKLNAAILYFLEGQPG